jgi:hypothetical protein
VRRTALAHGLADVWLTKPGSGARVGARRRCEPRMSQFAGSTTRCFRAATAGRCRVPVEQAFHLRTNSVRLSGAGQRAEGLRPERESTLPVGERARLAASGVLL